MSTREPAPVAILAARLQRAYPSLSPYSAASLATELSAIERAQRRHAERCCNGADGGYVKLGDQEHRNRAYAEAKRNGWRCATREMLVVHDPDAEQRAGARIERNVTDWHRRIVSLTNRSGVLYRDATDGRDGNTAVRTLHPEQSDAVVDLQGDPRGAVLLVRLPGEAEAVSV